MADILFTGDNARENAGAYWVTSEDAGGEMFEAYGTNNLILMRSKIRSGNTLIEFGIAISNGIPSDTNPALLKLPQGSLVINKAGGDGTSLYVKELGASVATGFAPVTTGDLA
jgi:hypothetical protein